MVYCLLLQPAAREGIRNGGLTNPEEIGKVVVAINKDKTVRKTLAAISKTVGVVVTNSKGQTKVTVHKNLQLAEHRLSKVVNNQIVHKTKVATNAIIPTDKAAGRDKTVTDQTEVADKVEVNNKEKIKILAITAGTKNNLVLK